MRYGPASQESQSQLVRKHASVLLVFVVQSVDIHQRKPNGFTSKMPRHTALNVPLEGLHNVVCCSAPRLSLIVWALV